MPNTADLKKKKTNNLTNVKMLARIVHQEDRSPSMGNYQTSDQRFLFFLHLLNFQEIYTVWVYFARTQLVKITANNTHVNTEQKLLNRLNKMRNNTVFPSILTLCSPRSGCCLYFVSFSQEDFKRIPEPFLLF